MSYLNPTLDKQSKVSTQNHGAAKSLNRREAKYPARKRSLRRALFVKTVTVSLSNQINSQPILKTIKNCRSLYKPISPLSLTAPLNTCRNFMTCTPKIAPISPISYLNAKRGPNPKFGTKYPFVWYQRTRYNIQMPNVSKSIL